MKPDLKQGNRVKALQELIAQEDIIDERVDAEGNRWRKVYFGGGEHCRNWLMQFKELGDVRVEAVDSEGFRCFEDDGEKLCRVWLKMDESGLDDLF